MKEIEDDSFPSWTTYDVAKDNETYSSINGVLYNKEATVIVRCPSVKSGVFEIPSSVSKIGYQAFKNCASLTSVTIPSSVSEIGWYAFDDCSSLTSITIPGSVSKIAGCAFRGCKSLTSVTIPSSVTEIGEGAFYGCTSFASIIIPSSVTVIGDGAFYDCTSLTSITIPGSVTIIGNGAFGGCTSLSDVTCLAQNPPRVNDYEWNWKGENLHVLPGCKQAYDQSGWRWIFQNIIEDAKE